MTTNHNLFQADLTCGNCLYNITYDLFLFNKQTMPDYITHTTCLLQKHNKPLTANNKFDADSTCDNHELGKGINSTAYSTIVVNLMTETNNPKLKALFAYRSDIVDLFKDKTKLRDFTLADKAKRSTNGNKP